MLYRASCIFKLFLYVVFVFVVGGGVAAVALLLLLLLMPVVSWDFLCLLSLFHGGWIHFGYRVR